MSRFISNDEILHRGKFAPKPAAIKVTVTPAPVAPVEVKAEPVIEPEVKEETKIEITEEQFQVREEVDTIPENAEVVDVAEVKAEPEVPAVEPVEVKAEPEVPAVEPVEVKAEPEAEAPVEEAPKPKKAPAKKKSAAKTKTDAE